MNKFKEKLQRYRWLSYVTYSARVILILLWGSLTIAALLGGALWGIGSPSVLGWLFDFRSISVFVMHIVRVSLAVDIAVMVGVTLVMKLITHHDKVVLGQSLALTRMVQKNLRQRDTEQNDSWNRMVWHSFAVKGATFSLVALRRPASVDMTSNWEQTRNDLKARVAHVMPVKVSWQTWGAWDVLYYRKKQSR
ncbi:hypothetical protein [Ligilactobacillus sp. LYQ60]|uniref:hypothetical protein n=1 Tax=unclassified Ligilactobacillus TaxID=2767920 RepID=UPI003852FD40